MPDIVILGATRTPVGAFQGGLAAVPAARLGAIAIKGALAQTGIGFTAATDVLMGNVLQAGQGQAPARQAAIYAGLAPTARSDHSQGVWLGSSGGHASCPWTRGRDGELYVAGGMKNMSLAPYLLPKAREGFRLGQQQVVDSIVADGLWDPYNNLHMGSCAEQCAAKYTFTREQQDAYAIESFRRANAAQKEGKLAAEITPIQAVDVKGNLAKIEHDEGPAKVKYDKIPTLKPSFQKNGTITPANASSLNDG